MVHKTGWVVELSVVWIYHIWDGETAAIGSDWVTGGRGDKVSTRRLNPGKVV